MSNSKWKKAGAIITGILLLAGLLGWLLYHNRLRYIPKVEKVTYLQVALAKGKAMVHAGVQVHNPAPFSLQIDSVSYQILSKGEVVGWGNQLTKLTLPAKNSKVLDFRLFLDTKRYRQQLARQSGRDSLDLDLVMQVYLNPPFLDQQTLTVKRTLSTAKPKAPGIRIDSFFVKSFSPDSGYVFQLNLNTGNTNLPEMELADLQYSIRLSDSVLISNKIDSTFQIKNGPQIITVPVHVETAELIGLLNMDPGSKRRWPYEAKVSATVKTNADLFENTAVTVTRSGSLDTRKLGSGSMAMPSLKRIQSLQLTAKEKNTFLEADLLVHNPTKLPLYIDSATYFVRYKGKVVAHGAADLEKVLPAKADKSLALEIAVNNFQYNQLKSQTQGKKEMPLEAELFLHYNLKNSKPQQIRIRKSITVPVTESPTFEFVDIGVKQLDPEKGAQLWVKLKVKNQGRTRLQLDDLKYRLLLKKDIDITGQMNQGLAIDPGTSEVDLPIHLTGKDVNQVVKGLVQGIETWEYAFNGTASISVPNSVIRQTEITLATNGVYRINSKGTPDYMPEISKIDTLHLTIHQDTAWVHMYAAIYNTLPATIHVSQLQVDVIHEKDTIGKTKENLDIYLAPDANSFAWHTLGVNYGLWQQHVIRQQGQDSILLNLPVSLIFDLGNLGKEQVMLDLSTRIPTPATPVTVLRRMQLRGFSFGTGLKFDALVTVQNANSEGLTVKNIDYTVVLDNGVNLCGKINRTYKIPVGLSEVQVPVNLSVWEGVKMLKRQFFGPPLLGFKLNATAQLRTDNPKLSDVFVIFENQDVSNLRQRKKVPGG